MFSTKFSQNYHSFTVMKVIYRLVKITKFFIIILSTKMKKKSNNFLKVMINQSKVVSSSKIESYTLKLKIMDQLITTDKIGGKVYDYNKVIRS